MSQVAAIADMLGGRKVLKLPVRRDQDLGEIVRSGIPSEAVRVLALRTHTSVGFVIEAAGLNRRTMERRLSTKAKLKKEESDGIVRVARIVAHATEALGEERGLRWLHLPNRALGGKRPAELLNTEADARVVEDVLVRIEHGVFS